MPPPIRRRAGSSGAAGTRSAGGSAASRPPPISTPRSPTGRSGWSGSTAMPAGPTAWRCGRPGSPPRRRRRPAAGSSGAGRNPSGIFVDAAMSLVERAVPPPLPLQRDRALQRAQEILLSNGLTSVADMGTSAEDWAVMRRAGDAGQLRMRIISYASGIDNLLAVAGTRPTPWLYDGRLRMVGVKLYLDGALGSRGAWLKAALSRRAGPARPAPGRRHRAQEPDEPGGDGQFPGRGPRDRRPGQRAAARRDRGAVRRPIRATGAGGSNMPRSSIRPTCRASRRNRHHRLDAADPPDLATG